MNISLRNSIYCTPSIGTAYPDGKLDAAIILAPNTRTHDLSRSVII